MANLDQTHQGVPERAAVLRVYAGESQEHQNQPLSEAIVLIARRAGLAGATVIGCPQGFGHGSRQHPSKSLRLSEDASVIIEIIDHPDRIEAFLPELEPLLDGGLVTVTPIRVVRYGQG